MAQTVGSNSCENGEEGVEGGRLLRFVTIPMQWLKFKLCAGVTGKKKPQQGREKENHSKQSLGLQTADSD